MKRTVKNSLRIHNLRARLANYHYGLMAVLAVWGGYFTWLWLNIFRYDARGDIVAGHSIVWADWAAHLTYASVFAFRAPSDWFIAHPLFAGAKFSYPFLPDAISGLLMRAGLDVVPAFIIPSILATFALLYVFYRFTYHFTGRVKGALLVVSLFFTSGGFGFLYFLQSSGARYDWYTHLPEHGIYFINFIIGEMLPQRTFLFGLPIALTIILLIEKIVTVNKKKANYFSVIAGLLAGILSIIHPHSLIVVVFVSAAYAIRFRPHYKQFLLYAVIAGTCIGIYWLTLLHGSGSASMPYWRLGWMSQGYDFLTFELLNFGIIMPLGVYSAWRQKWLTHPLFIGSIFIFIVCHLVSFQAWEWDNTKLFTYAYLFLLLPIAKQLVAWWEVRNNKLQFKLSTIIFIVLLGVSGTIDIIRLSQISAHSYTLVSSVDQTTVKRFRQIARSGSIIIDSQKSNQPFTMLGNTQTVMAYEGWLWSYGIDYTKAKHDINQILSGANNALQLLNQYRISYIIVDKDLRQSYQINDTFLRQFPIVQSNQSISIFKIHP